MISRRAVLVLSVGTLAAAKLPSTAFAQDANAERHGMSAFGDLALAPDFKHFAYVNPDAPKGGKYSESVSSRGYNGSFLTFDSLNAYILKGTGAFGLDYTFATLMTANADEPDAMYGFAARAVRIAIFSRRRSTEEGIRSPSRYLATVRRARTMPSAASRSMS